MAESGEKTRKRGRRNTISDFDINNERGLDMELLRNSGILSPEHKKKKSEENTEPDKIITYDEMNDEKAFVCDSLVLSELMSGTKNYGVGKLIECFNAMFENDVELIKKHMLDHSGYGKDSIPIYKLAIKYVTNSDEEINETDIGELAEILIAAIKNRMTKHCEDCGKWYMVGRGNKPKKTCVMCKVGQHDCVTETNDTIRSGDKWFCKECNEQFTDQNKQIKCRNIYFKGFEENEQTREIRNDAITKLRECAKNAIIEEDDLMFINIEEEQTQKTKEEEEKKKKKEEEVRIRQEEEKKKKEREKRNNNARTACKYFLTSACRFGDKCRNFHPEICKEWAAKGSCANINADPNCKLAHPKKCGKFACNGHKCNYVHPTNVSKRNQNKPPTNFNNSHQIIKPRDKPQYEDQGFNIDPHSRNFLETWPLPMEATMHRFMAQIDQRMNQMDARWEKMEKSRISSRGYYY